MPQRRIAYAWARGLGAKAVQVTLLMMLVLATAVGLLVFLLRDTPPAAAATYHPDGTGMDGLLPATLQMSRACITVRADGQTWVPIFPGDSVRLHHDALIYDGDPFRTGDEIALPGGEVDSAPSGARIPKDCPQGLLWLVAG